MKLYMVEFDDRDVPVIEEGIAIETHDAGPAANLGADVGGQTLAMVPLRIPLVGIETPADRRLREAQVVASEDGALSFHPSLGGDEAFVVLSVIQRSPEARTEVDPYGDGVACIGNAFERPMDRQLLTMAPGARIRFRRFGRGGHYGRWYVVEWNGSDLMAGEEEASEAP
jgi:hypothetical protein